MSISRLNESLSIIPEPADEARTRIFGTDSSPISRSLVTLPPPPLRRPFFRTEYFFKVCVFGNIFQTRTLKSEAEVNPLLERDSRNLKVKKIQQKLRKNNGVLKYGRFEYSILSLLLRVEECNVPKMDASNKVYFETGKIRGICMSSQCFAVPKYLSGFSP